MNSQAGVQGAGSRDVSREPAVALGPTAVQYIPDEPVSVVLVCRNKADVLPYIIAALARNTRRPDLVVLSDDASADGSPQQFENACKQHCLECRVVKHSADGMQFRINTLRNAGIDACDDGLILLLDADHVPARTHIEAHVELHLINKGPTLSTGPRLEYALANCAGPINFMWGHEPITMLQTSTTESVPSWTAVLASNLGVTKRSTISLGRFDTQYDGHYGYDDVDFMYRAWESGYFFAASFEAHVIHYPHEPFQKRDGSVNKLKFEQKHGFALQYHPLVGALNRGITWHDFYQTLAKAGRLAREPKHDTVAPQSQAVVVPMLDLDRLSTTVLVKGLARKGARWLRQLGRR